MERGEIKASVCVPPPKKRYKLEEHSSVGIIKRPYDTVRRRHHQDRAKKQKRTKEKWTKKRNSRDKPRPSEVKEKLVDAGSKEESLAQPAGEGNSRDKPNPDEVNKIVVDAGSKEESIAEPAGEGKRRKRLVTEEVVDFFVSVELADYMLCKPLRTIPEDTITRYHFSTDLDDSISALIKERTEHVAGILRQYRTNQLAEFQPEATN